MLGHIIEELESILYETSILKNDLNSSCEKGWNLLCPPGSQINGFKIQKELPSADAKVGNSDVINIPPSLGSIIDSATELIAHGKLLRSSAKVENKKMKGSNISSDVRKDSQNQPQVHKSKTNSIKEERNSKHSNHPRGNHRLNNNQTSNKRDPHLKQSLYTNRKKSSALENTHKVRDDAFIAQSENQECLDIAENRQLLSKDSECLSLQTPKYSHSCSLTLSDFVKTLNVPEDMQYLLQRYHHYESHKLKYNSNKEGHNALNFSERINNFAKCKLGKDLKTSIKEKDRYMKYLDVADEVCRGKVEETSLGSSSIIWYRSEEQLRSYEEKCQRLLELQLQRRLISVLEMYSK
uniref:Uncharacterized protein n=1 Tax=Graphocephala atropunctata TaxID=36148 RepID=A0A1B6LWV6_9HEMI